MKWRSFFQPLTRQCVVASTRHAQPRRDCSSLQEAWLSCQLSGGVAQLSAVSTHLNSLHDSEADTEGREVMPRMTATK